MEASGSTTNPPPPTGEPVDRDEKAGAGWRILAFILALALIFATAVMIVIAINPDDTPRCEQVVLAQAAGECYDTGKTQQTVQAGFALAAGIAGAIAVLLALFMTFTGRRASTTVKATTIAVVLGAITVLIGQL